MTSVRRDLMPCHEAVQLLWEYLDGELDAERHQRVRDHLRACEHCRDHFVFEEAFLRYVASLSESASEAERTTALRQRVLTALRDAGYGDGT